MRVALLTTNLQPDNGWATVAVQRGAALMAQGVDIVALTARQDRPPIGITPTEVRPVLPRLRPGNRKVIDILLSSQAIQRATADCDLVDSVCEPYALGCLPASRRGVLVVTAHGSYVPLVSARGPASAIYRAIYRRVHIAAVSAYTARRVAQALGTPPPVVVLSGVDYDFYQPARPRPDKRGPTVLCVGAVKKRKGVHILIEAIAQAARSIPDLQCVVAGKLAERGYTRLIREQVARLGLEDRVHLVGHLPYEEVIGWYQAADLFVMPSLSGPTHFEGFGLVILEANACGLPAIGSRDSGNESAIEEGVSGYLVAQRDPQALGGRIVEVLADDALRRRLAQGARDFAQAHTWQRSAADMLRFYESVLAENQQGASR